MHLFQEIKDSVGFTNRKLTPDEVKDVKAKMKELKGLESEIKKLENKLNKKITSYAKSPLYSSVFYDTPGFTYHVRKYPLTNVIDLV